MTTNIVTRLLCEMPGNLSNAFRTMTEAAEIIQQYRYDAVNDEALILKLEARIEALEAALRDVIRDIDDYERINNLAPSPGKTECWQSVANARIVLDKDERK